MVINISVQYSGGLLPDIILLTQGYYQWGTRLNTIPVHLDGAIIDSSTVLVTMYYCGYVGV